MGRLEMGGCGSLRIGFWEKGNPEWDSEGNPEVLAGHRSIHPRQKRNRDDGARGDIWSAYDDGAEASDV